MCLNIIHNSANNKNLTSSFLIFKQKSIHIRKLRVIHHDVICGTRHFTDDVNIFFSLNIKINPKHHRFTKGRKSYDLSVDGFPTNNKYHMLQYWFVSFQFELSLFPHRNSKRNDGTLVIFVSLNNKNVYLDR